MVLILPALLLGGVSLFVTAQGKSVRAWRVLDIQRQMSDDNITCDWSLQVSQSEVPDVLTACKFTVLDAQHRACNLVQFSQKCTAGSGLQVNGGHSDLGFTVLVLYDPYEDAKAYFGASEDALLYHADIPVQVKLAYPVSRSDKDWLGLDERGDRGLQSTTRSWMAQNVSRVIDPVAKRITLDFEIQDTDDTWPVPCHIVVEANDVDLETLQWSYQKCDGSDYSVSWGYTPVSDAGIMTVILPEQRINSFFGFNDVSKKWDLGSAGPNPVIPL